MAGQLVRRGERVWLLRLFLGREAGKRRYLNRTVHGGRKDAERLLRSLLAARDRGDLTTPSRVPVGDYLKAWLADYATGAVAPTTFASYEQTIRNHLAPSLGHIPLQRLSPPDIQGYLSRKLQEGLSPTSVGYHRAILREALAHAVRWGLLTRNPCDLVDPPRAQRYQPAVLDEEQVRLFLAEAKRPSPYHPLYLAALTTGMRQGELLGLRGQDVNFALRIASVQQTLYRLGGRMLFKEPKSPKARRTIALPPVLVETLGELRTRQEERRRLTGDCAKGRDCRDATCAAWHDYGLVFCQPNGRPLHGHNVAQRDFRRLLTRAGLPKIRFHDLRHCHATLLLQQGVHPKIVQERLGHSTISMTLDTYSHVVPGMQEQAVAGLQARLFGSPENRAIRGGA